MVKRRKRTRVEVDSEPPNRTSHPSERRSGRNSLTIWLSPLVIILFAARFWVPAEGTAQGETLLIASLWFFVGGIFFWHLSRVGERPVSWNRIDTGIAILVAGHLLSAVLVLLGTGHKRYALNGLIEWAALGVSWVVLRNMILSAEDRSRWAAGLLGTLFALSLVGLWQHYVWYESASREYIELRDEYDSLRDNGTPTASDQVRYRELERELLANGIPLDPQGRALWEQRLLGSREALGRFALANTFGGVLLIGFLFGLEWLRREWGNTATPPEQTGSLRLRLAFPILLLTAIGLCLILTKSRTAYVGTIVGILVWGVSLRARKQIRTLRIVGLGGALIVVALLFATVSGGIDREVVSEAPQSLRYRLEYWTGTVQVIADHPLFGTGYGNFRQAYLRHKLPDSSEEIADPHQFVLDLWVSGGLIALVGFVWVGWSVAGNASAPAEPAERAYPVWLPWIFGFLLPIGFASFVGGLPGYFLFLPLVAFGLLAGFARRPFIAPSKTLVIATTVGLLVHLSGAGGIEMPAVVQIIFVLLVFLHPGFKPEPIDDGDRRSSYLTLGITGILIAAFATSVIYGFRAVTSREMSLATGDALVVNSPNAGRAIREYGRAAEADPLSPEPWSRMADTHLRAWESGGAERIDQDFLSAVDAYEEMISRNPRSHYGYERLAVAFLTAARKDDDLQLANRAVAEAKNAFERYPTDPELTALLAEAYAEAGERQLAAAAAEKAIDLDRLNRDLGHYDRMLPDERIAKLEELID